MDTPTAPSGGSSSNSGGQHNSSGQARTGSSGRNKERQQKLVNVRIQPTIGPPFSLSLPYNTKISDLKETISDKMGLSPQKMTLLLHNSALESGTLTDNKIEDGTELRLVPAIESGVTMTKVSSVDPVAMMKHSMSGISDKQIDDFLNGKFPLSVAIRVGESVVVVNLHRAKVEEIEIEPPPQKRRCVRARRPSNRDEVDYIDPLTSALYATKRHHHHHHTSASSSPSSRDGFRCLNTNHSGPEIHPSAAATLTSDYHHHHHHHHHRRTNSCAHPLDAASSKLHRSLGKSRDSSSTQRHHHHHHRISRALPPSPPSSLSQAPDRSMLTCTHDLSGTPMETSVAIAATTPVDSACHPTAPHDAPIIKDIAPVLTTITPKPNRVLTRVIKDARHRNGPDNSVRVPSLFGEESVELTTTIMKTDTPSIEGFLSGTGIEDGSKAAPMDCSSETSSLSGVGCSSSKPASHSIAACPSSAVGHCSSKSVSHSVQTELENSGQDKQNENRAELHSSKDRKSTSSSRREIKLPENGISMKRKAVMEAISEILKKMYANTEKGRLPGSFKGRFSSEFTCDSDMREILHSKTTMTSYGSEGDELNGRSCDTEMSGRSFEGGGSNLSKAKLEENQSLKDKVANLKWQLQHKRAMKIARRKGDKSPCGWMEALSCEVPGAQLEPIKRTGYCGMKRGFLLDPYC